LISYALVPQSLPNLLIPQGFRLKGAVSIFGVTGKIDIMFSSALLKFAADFELSPIDFFGVVKVTSYDG